MIDASGYDPVAAAEALAKKQAADLARAAELMKTAILCRLTNPSKRARIIYNGMDTVPIRINPNETIEVVLSEHVADKIIDEENLDPKEPDLHLVELGAPPPPPPKASEVRASARRTPRPARRPAPDAAA